MQKNPALSFWEHLDELRGVLFRILALTLVLSLAAFCFKDFLFAVILAPKEEDFVTYRLLRQLSELWGTTTFPEANVRLINTALAEQFLIHIRAAFSAGILGASPYILCSLYRFVAPALYVRERRYAVPLLASAYLLFLAGSAVCYFLVFPLTFRFLGTYQVSAEVPNLITLTSYISTLFSMTLALGVVFEIPVLSWIMGKLGLLSASFMRRYRRHVAVGLLVLAAIITPTSDVLTLLLVALPMWLLYEASILLVAFTTKEKDR